MRSPLFLALAGLALAGCQTLRPPLAVPSPEPAPQRLPTTDDGLSRETALGVLSPTASQAPVQQAQHVEPMPVPPPEALPHGALRPVALGRLALADLEQMAIAANPSVARAAALVQAARGNWIQAGLPPNPNVGYEGQQIGSAGRAEQDGVFVEQEFVRGGKLRLNRQVAAQEWARREQELAAQQQRVITDVRIAYYQVLVAERQQKLTERTARNRQGGRQGCRRSAAGKRSWPRGCRAGTIGSRQCRDTRSECDQSLYSRLADAGHGHRQSQLAAAAARWQHRRQSPRNSVGSKAASGC